jgi:hypothetical protein
MPKLPMRPLDTLRKNASVAKTAMSRWMSQVPLGHSGKKEMQRSMVSGLSADASIHLDVRAFSRTH